jgi:curli biogenesis system outer membrane secretion channel CsgG
MSLHRERWYSYLFLAFSLLSVLGCAPTKTVFYKKPDKSKTASYQVIEIPNFTKTDKEWVPYDSYTQIPDMIAEKLRTSNRFSEIRRSSSNSASEERVLLVQGSVTGYSRGCKFCEWFIRVNDKGKSSVSVRVRLIDKATGEILADTSIQGRAKKPGYGKSRYVRIVDEIVSLIQGINNKGS